MKTVTVRTLRVVVYARKKVKSIGKDVPVNYAPKTDTVNAGRLAVDNELTRMKYCV
jgi:hypothetical protein